MSMLAELTHRCPLSCPYCSNPLDMVVRDRELSAEDWADVFAQAADLGVLQLHLSGGEPAARRDLEEITASAVAAGLYTNLITSGIGLTERRLGALAAIGLDHVQLSLQGVDAAMADRIG
ncbi:MAG: radical SAM protein, partial [Pseudomonadota bacterium]